MTKKDYILKMLDLIQDIFPPAQDLKVLVAGDVVSDGMINTLITMLKEVREVITDEAAQEKMDNAIGFMNKLKAVEGAERAKDEESLKELENIFKKI